MSYADVFLKKYRLLEEESKNDGNKIQITKEQKAAYDKLIEDLRKRAYPDAVAYLNSTDFDKMIGDKKLQFLLSLGFGGPLGDIKLQSSDTAITVSSLLPTQNEIDVNNSLKFALSGNSKTPTSAYFSGKPITIVTPIVTFRENYVIDGHHRWSQAYLMNPDCEITAVNFNSKSLSPQQVLKAVQATIASNTGEVPQETVKGTNIYAASEDQLRKEITELLADSVAEELIKILKKQNKEEVIDYLVGNCMKMKADNAPINGAPARGDMPQTDKDPHFRSDLERGVTKI